MANSITYKGYTANIEYDPESSILHGKIFGINDLVTFESDNAKDIIHEFHAAVDEYLDFCKEVGKQPDKEYKGQFNVRIPSELHRKLALEASKESLSLNAMVEKCIASYLA